MSFGQTVILAALQGFTEFLPVSSSAHLLLVPVLTGWQDQGLAFDVGLHAGSLAAVILYFRKEIGDMISGFWGSVIRKTVDDNARLAWAIIFGTLPVGLAGLLLRDVVAGIFRSPIVTAAGLIGFGLLLGWADWKKKGDRSIRQLGWRDVVLIGCAQALALIPGTSRSGITITAGLMAGFSREAAARFSFLLSIPVITLAGMLETATLIKIGDGVDWVPLVLGMLISSITAFTCIHYFLAFIRRIGMQPFVIYRIVLGGLLLILYL
ncbi:MAG: undecaprenyl-diphosphate phosphatase [Desulfotignum sp.]